MTRDSVEDIRRERDAARRARRATDLIGQLVSDIAVLSEIRIDAVRELLRADWTQTDVARLLGLGKARITQMLKP